jgi:hypothetical protein
MAPSHGSFAPSMPFGYSGGAIARAPVSYPSSIFLMSPGVRYPGTPPINRPNFYHPGHGTNTHGFIIRSYPIYPNAYAYPAYGYGYLPSDLGDDSDGNYDLSQQPSPDQQPDYGYPQPMPQPDYGYPQPMPVNPGYPPPVPDGAYAYPAPPPGYEVYPQPAPAEPLMQYVPSSATTVILIYKDGRPPEQIQNYLATRSTLTILDGGRRREVPLTDLNIPATISANRQTGVDFELPTAPQ